MAPVPCGTAPHATPTDDLAHVIRATQCAATSPRHASPGINATCTSGIPPANARNGQTIVQPQEAQQKCLAVLAQPLHRSTATAVSLQCSDCATRGKVARVPSCPLRLQVTRAPRLHAAIIVRKERACGNLLHAGPPAARTHAAATPHPLPRHPPSVHSGNSKNHYLNTPRRSCAAAAAAASCGAATAASRRAASRQHLQSLRLRRRRCRCHRCRT